MINILYYCESWGVGGIESFIMNAIRGLDSRRYSFDIFNTHDSNIEFDKEIKKLKGRRFSVFHNCRPNLVTRSIKSFIEFNRILKTRKYDVVHINTMNGLGFVYSALAKMHNVPIRIVHSHNSSFGSGSYVVKKITHELGILLFSSTATRRIACSETAGKYLFKNKPFEIIQNGINLEKFSFSSQTRFDVRKQLDLPQEALVFGSVGRLTKEKNPQFQLEILSALHKFDVPAFLLLVGDGPEMSNIVNRAEQLGLSQFVRMPGTVLDAYRYFHVLDFFVMPSFFEGMPIAAVEAFTSGLPLLLSTSVPSVTLAKSDHEYHLPLDDANVWANKIIELQACKTNDDRTQWIVRSQEQGFGVKSMVKKLEIIYQKK